jgi:hypothetical protein
MNYKKEFKKLNKDPEYLKELRKLDKEEYQFVSAKLAQTEEKVKHLEKIIASQRHELALQAKFREEDKYARQMLDKNACQRRVEELEIRLSASRSRHKACLDDVRVWVDKYESQYDEIRELQKKLDDLQVTDNKEELEKPSKGIDYEKDFEELNKDPEYIMELLKLEQEKNDYLQSKVKSCEKILSELYNTLIKGDGPMSWQIISLWKKEQKNELQNL